jgi:hypothetical protein
MADAYFSATESAVFIPEVWAKEVLKARESALRMANRVERYDVDFASGGDILHIPGLSNLTAGNISTSTGALDSSSVTESDTTLTVDQWKGIIIDVLDIVKKQSRYNLMDLYAPKMGYALAKVVDTALLAKYDGLSQSVGADSTDLTDANIRRAIQYLDDADAPFEDRFAVIKPAQKNAILGIDKFVRYDATGNGSRIQTGDIGEIYGVKFMVSSNVAVSGAETKNMMWQKSAFGLAMVKNITVEKLARTKFSDRLAASELYGSAELRDDHAVKLHS